MKKKTKLTAGADERTPSIPQYFSWINNTNEGSTEEQTIINLDYFNWLNKEYGMQLKIYAWDAGNLDGAGKTYQTLDSPKLKNQFPNGYGPIVDAAEKAGIRMGVWCGPDGFGRTAKSAAQRHEMMVSLCRDYHFAEFKIDGVCGPLSVFHRRHFVKMMKECRRYSPDLILLNHRLSLGSGMPYATTSLWNDNETYVDVFIANTTTAPHHRAYFCDRGNVPNLERLYEDHGVCISSCLDYFEDDLIFQAFGRCLILAPEIYGNPWLLRDDEQAHLARIYNLHRKYSDILVDGMLLPASYGKSATARGSSSIRFLTLGNQAWKDAMVKIKLDGEIGLGKCEKVAVSAHHPFERFYGVFDYGSTVEVPVEAFRAALIKVCDASLAEPMLTDCEYEVLHETNGTIDKVKIVSASGGIHICGSDSQKPIAENCGKFDNTMREPVKLGKTETVDIPDNAAELFEFTQFAQNHDSLESRSLERSGETKIPEVQAARDAFFSQKTYFLRGPEGRFAFDGKPDTFFDGVSKTFFGGLRVGGGCLRADFGEVYDADCVRFEYFEIDKSMNYEIKKQTAPKKASYSTDLADWQESYAGKEELIERETADVLIYSVHNIVQREGERRCVTYPVNGGIRYFRMPCPLSRIYKISLIKNGRELELRKPKVNNLLPAFEKRKIAGAEKCTVRINSSDWREGCYLSVAIEGVHGKEGAYALARSGGKLFAATDRAPSYNSNVWECRAEKAMDCDRNYTYFIPIERDMCDCDLEIIVIKCDPKNTTYHADVYLCDKNKELDGLKIDVDLK